MEAVRGPRSSVLSFGNIAEGAGSRGAGYAPVKADRGPRGGASWNEPVEGVVGEYLRDCEDEPPAPGGCIDIGEPVQPLTSHGGNRSLGFCVQDCPPEDAGDTYGSAGRVKVDTPMRTTVEQRSVFGAP